MAHEIKVSGQGGEYMESVTVVEWKAAVGDEVKAGDVVAVVETAKASSEVEAPGDGVLSKILADAGDEVDVGATIAVIGDADEADTEAASQPPEPAPETPEPGTAEGAAPGRKNGDGSRVVASPLARRVAGDLGVALGHVEGTGPGGRIKKRDVERVAREQPASKHRRQELRESSRGTRLHGAWLGSGTGTPLVLIHGFGADVSTWHWLVPHLTRDRRVLVLDLPGHGSSPPEAPAGFAELVDCVAQALHSHDIAEWHLVGHSLGGAVALAIAAQGDIATASLCLVAPAGLGPEINGDFLAGYLRATEPDSIAPWLKRLFADPAAMPERLPQRTLKLREDAGLAEAQAELARRIFPDGTQAIDLRAALSKLALPAKIVWGRDDRIIPWRHALAAPGRVGLHLFEAVGHMPQLEAPEATAALIRELTAAGGETS